MAVSAGTAFVGIEGDFSALNKQVSSHFSKLSKQAGAQGKKLGSSLGAGMATGLKAGAGVAAVGVGALTAEVVKATKGWSEHEAIVRRSNAVIKSTAGVAQVSAKHIGTLTDAIERQVGVDGDLAAEGANLLLTFTNIRNGLGKNNKIFDEATKTAVNMSKALGQDVKGSAIQLGKALNDPVKGVSALSKVGVSFTEQQKKQIKTLVASGKTMEAQKLILRELAKEFPKVDATPFEKLVSVGRQVEDTIGKAVLPIFNKFVKTVTPGLQHVANVAADVFSDKNLSWEEKFQKLGKSIRHWFGPMAESMVQGLRDAHLDDKLKSAILWAEPKILEGVKKIGTAAATTLWEGFKEAPLWAKVGGGAFLARKLGLTASALKPMMALLSGKGISSKGGGAAGTLAGRGATPLTPLFVSVVGGGLPGAKGPGGGPIVTGVPGAAPNAGKFKTILTRGVKGVGIGAGIAIAGEMAASMLGDIVGGESGKKIDKIGSRAATWGGIGAMAGSFIAPGIGTAIGGGVGAIAGALSTAITNHKGEFEKIGKQLGASIAPEVQARLPADFDAKTTAMLKEMDRRTAAIKSRTSVAQTQIAGAAPDAVGPIVAALGRANAGDVAKVAELGKKLGTTIATAYTAAIDQHHEFFGASQLTKGFTAELQKLPAQARQGAYDTMINWANTLVQQGRLPRTALNTLIGNFKTTMNLLPSGISEPAKRGIDSLTAQFRRRDMVTAAGSMINELKRKYGEFPALAKTTGDNLATNFLKSIEFLRDGAMHATGRLKTQTKADLKSTRDAALKYAGDMNSGLNAELISMGVKGSKNSKKVRDNIVLAFTEMASGTGTASDATAQSLYTALQNMDLNADEILSALGITVPKVSLTRPPLARAGPPGTPGWNQMRPTQTGAYITGGKPTGDSVPILAERGEYMLNRKAVKKIGKRRLDQLNFGEAPRFQAGGLISLIKRANEIDAAGYPYKWGGGHDAAFSGPYDCSGAISAILHAAGLLQMPMVSGALAHFGKPGAGSQFTWYANPDHVYGKIGNRFWGTSTSNPGGGAGYFDGSVRSGFTVRHVDLIDPTLAVQHITGMPGNLTDIATGELERTRDKYQDYINDQIGQFGSVGGGNDGDSTASSTGNGADLMRQISSDRGWNFADWWALDAKESSHGTNLSNPTSTARLRGQFLDSNWGKYGIGSDPRKNPSMSQQIQSMAQYIAERYTNPTRAWAAWQSHFPPGWYSSGGMISKMLQVGGATAAKVKKKVKPPKVKNKRVDASTHSKKHKPKDHVTDAMLADLKTAGASGLVAAMSALEFESDKFADWAQRAGDITNTEALQAALNAQMALLGGRSEMSQPELDKLFPPAQQDAFIEAWLRNPANGALFNSGTQSDWLSQELNQLLAWRNSLIDNPPQFFTLKKAAEKAWADLDADIKRLEADIKLWEDRRDRARKKKDDRHADLVDKKAERIAAEKDLNKHPKSKTRQAKVRRLRREEEEFRSEEAVALNDQRNANKQLAYLRGEVRERKAAAETLGGDDGKGGRVKDLADLIEPPPGGMWGGTLGASLVDVHGIGSTMQRFVSPSQYQLGTLGGTILSVQNEILGLTANPLRATAEQAGAEPPGPGEGEERAKELLGELLRQANLRASVAELQYEVLRGLPFGGTFHTGGVVPGPIGAPRMILAQGGEVVLTNEAANSGPNVSVNFANGMEWLRQFVDIRVEDQTRTQGRRGERQLPGRPGTLR